MIMKSTIRLNKYISEKGICSRREADKLIEKGFVFVNGKRALIGAQVKPGDKVMVNGIKLDMVEEKPFILLALNKPPGITSTAETNVKGNIVDFVNHSERIFPIGRLDKDSQGLIFLTNNGDIVNEILRAGNKHEKEYIVTVDKPLTDSFIEGMSAGVPIMGKNTKKCPVFKVSPFVFRIILVQGMNRQIRRMCEYFGYEVTKLERIRIMNVILKGLPQGDWRELEDDEKAGILQMVEKTAPPKSLEGRVRKTYPSGADKEEKSSAAGKGRAERKPSFRRADEDRKGGKGEGRRSRGKQSEDTPRDKSESKGKFTSPGGRGGEKGKSTSTSSGAKREGAAPVKRGGAAPVKRGGAAPAKRGGTASVKREGTAPVKREGTAPAKRGGTSPTKRGGTASTKRGGTSPVKGKGRKTGK
ncbi:MAG: 23S rRNA pseudouridine(2604) synthase RluF [Bacteroidetes bacterium]|nr:MAG: 23S rRNA pseudouridine(2604) synthase RluF [Bacteroidota bacterium]